MEYLQQYIHWKLFKSVIIYPLICYTSKTVRPGYLIFLSHGWQNLIFRSCPTSCYMPKLEYLYVYPAARNNIFIQLGFL